MMMHHNTKFSNNMLVGFEDTIWTNNDILTLCCDLDPENSKPTFLQNTLVYDDASQYHVWWQNVHWFRRYHLGKQWHFDLCCDLDLDRSHPIFHRTLRLLMLHHHTKYNKMFCDSEDIIRTNIHNVLSFRRYLDKHSQTFWITVVTLTLNAVIQFFHRTLRLMMQYYQTTFGCKWNSSLEDIVEILIFCLSKPLRWSWHWR